MKRFSRRRFLSGALLAGALPVAAGAAHATEETEALELVQVSVPISTLPPEFEGYRIGFLTDLHYGLFISRGLIERSVREAIQGSVDLALLGGDYIWSPETGLPRRVARPRSPEFEGLSDEEYPYRVFEGLVSILRSCDAPDGLFGVYGNHDRWNHPTACGECFERGGVPLLLNEARTIRRGEASLVLVGVDDYLTGIPELPPLEPRERSVKILLSHNPDFPSELLQRGAFDFDLALSGHTHGGQIRLPGVGALVTNVADERFVAGLVQVENGGFVYTSRGIGVVEIPYRFLCPPEATILRLTRG